MRRAHYLPWLLSLIGALAIVPACGDNQPGAPDAAPLSSAVGPVPPSPQRPGDAARGYHTLVNDGYVSCGIPSTIYHRFFAPATPDQLIPGRDGPNATLPYSMTEFTAASGTAVVTANCLTCHAGEINGKLVLGLGNAAGDFTKDVSADAELVGAFAKTDGEKLEWRKWADRVEAIAPYTQTVTIGVNPADNLAAVLFAHRDRATLAWSYEAILPLPPPMVVPVDVPPWWRMKKKNAMFYDGAGRGDHARFMMSASALCTDSVEEARAIDATFPDVRAWILSIVPPAWPFAVDTALAARGETVYQGACASCHGTYGAAPTYPNLVVAALEVGTDPMLGLNTAQFAGRFVSWFNGSFYGEISHLAPAPGYYAPPLDGIWATAPFLHNGSVPTMATLLDSKTRPVYWSRTFDSTDYDPATVGWRFTAENHGQAAEADATKRITIYDTTLPGYSNAGHTYGDPLTADDRTALLEYLKTL